MLTIIMCLLLFIKLIKVVFILMKFGILLVIFCVGAVWVGVFVIVISIIKGLFSLFK
jgi:hypothetical protein